MRERTKGIERVQFLSYSQKSMQLTPDQTHTFQETIWNHYRQNARANMPWRQNPTPYRVLISEIMLQQTQVNRVTPKFQSFIQQFPSITALAQAPFSQVLALWNGLGYNRRAKYLWQAAQAIMQNHNGTIPNTIEELIKLPGIGKNTAGAIMAYAYNQPAVFIETNIRTVYIHHFAPQQEGIDDKTIGELVSQTLDQENPREWYWALMDYGTHLKQTQPSNIQQSKHYTKQSKFQGSLRQIRGQLLRELIPGPQQLAQLQQRITDPRLTQVVQKLKDENFIRETDGLLELADLP